MHVCVNLSDEEHRLRLAIEAIDKTHHANSFNKLIQEIATKNLRAQQPKSQDTSKSRAIHNAPWAVVTNSAGHPIPESIVLAIDD